MRTLVAVVLGTLAVAAPCLAAAPGPYGAQAARFGASPALLGWNVTGHA
ncbi:MAG TPA: hypothetical protein VFR27_12940 [Mycobacterium sp.]|nr:hypothetical protein [Mycobacterium sp.]